MKKRGQATVFIVIGLLVLFVIGGVIAYKFWYVSGTLERQLDLHANLPEEIKPVAQVLDSCTGDLVYDGVNILGVSGGFIEVPDEDFSTNLFVPLSSSLNVAGIDVPVWFRERPTGEQVVNVPTKEDMELQLSGYIENNFYKCAELLADFSGYTFSAVNPDVDVAVNILDERVDVKVEYPVMIEIKENEFQLNEHVASAEIPLGKLYEKAMEIMESENENYFLEKKTIEMLIAYDEEVPYSGVDLECSEKVWSKESVIKRFKEILQANVGSLKVKGTSFENAENYFVVDALNDGEGVSVMFTYSPSWPTYVEIEPSDGDFLKGDVLSRGTSGFVTNVLSSFFCFSTHHFIYDIKYPVLVTLTDKDTGFVFNFAVQVLIDNNQPRKNRFDLVSFKDENKVCEGANKELKVRAGYFEGEDYYSVDDADVFFKCYPAKCTVGMTNKGYVSGDVPSCVNGIVTAEKQGFYRGKVYDVSTNSNADEVNVVLNKIYTKKVNVLLIDKNTGETRKPYDNEQVSFEFLHSEGFTGRVFYPDDEFVDLIPGDYSVRSYVVGESTWPITTSKEKIEKCVGVSKGGLLGVLGKKDERCFEIETEPFELDFAMKGGVNFEFSLSDQELVSGDVITLYTIVGPVASDAEGLMGAALAADTNDENPNFRYPVI